MMRPAHTELLRQLSDRRAWKSAHRAFEQATGFHLELGHAAERRDGYPIEVFGQIVAWLHGRAHPELRTAAAELAATLITSHATTLNLSSHVARLWKEINFVYEIGESIANPLDLARSCQSLLELALDVVGARRGSIFLVEDGELRPCAARGVPAEYLIPIALDDPQSIGAWVVRHGTPLTLGDASRRPPALRAHGFPLPVEHSDSLLSVPLEAGPGRQDPLGVMNLAGKSGGQFASEDQKLVAAIARQAAGAIHQTRLMGRILATERLHEEMRLASEIHEGLLPECMPEIPGYEVAAALRPASAVGGDYYDFLQQGDRFCLLIADVAGHGLGAALLVSTVRSTLRAACRSGLPPGDVMSQLNDVVGDLSGETGLFATAQVVELRGSQGCVAAAAHPPALRVRPGAGVTRIGQSGPPAGALAGASYPEQDFQLAGGETLILYTDGLLESAGAVGLSGLEASLTAAAGMPPSDLVERLLARLDLTEEPADDRTVLAIHRREECRS